MERFLAILATMLVALAFTVRVADACPMCSEAVENGKSATAQDLPRGVYYSVLFMLSMPFLLTGSFGVAFYRLSARRSSRTGDRSSIPGDSVGESAGDWRDLEKQQGRS